ncbi:hypothetical protein [Lapidilactobacillus achengensis]|uniref:hypothetical protein n=1 Tax=Lapidilactobacillus achengensis TaxID=2486000 RepID=UPI0013DDAFE2|nr:hypothetical protein [Lapidilactobacillus achengensis]
MVGRLYLLTRQSLVENRPIRLIHQDLAAVHQVDCPGVTNSKLATTNHGRQLRGSTSTGDSLPDGVSAQTAVKTLSGWSGEIRGEIAVSLFLAALPLRIRLSFEIRALCEAQSDAHSELTPNFAAQAAANILSSGQCRVAQAAVRIKTPGQATAESD